MAESTEAFIAKRQVRHIKSLSGRNFRSLSPVEAEGQVSTPAPNLLSHYFFSLHRSHESLPFYTSAISNFSSNPDWGLITGDEDFDGDYTATRTLSHIVLKFWTFSLDTNALFDPKHRFDSMRLQREIHPFILHFEIEIDLSELVALEAEAPSSVSLYPLNTLLFRLQEGLYVLPSTLRILVESRQIKPAPISQPPTSPSNAKTMSLNQFISLLQQKENKERLKEERDLMEIQVEELLEQKEKLNKLLGKKEALQLILAQRLRENEALKERIRSEVEEEKLTYERLMKLKASEVELMSQKAQLDQAQLDSREVLLKLARINFLKRCHILALIYDLERIYPIRQSKDSEESELWTIRGIHLPHSDFVGVDEELCAAALGFTAHLTLTIAKYLDIPLRYELISKGSRSLVSDYLSNPGQYPLYSRGVDRTRFEYGVFLLNKDIEQLCHAHQVDFGSLRETLPNLKTLIASLLKRRTAMFSLS